MNEDLNVIACRPGDLSSSERAAYVRLVMKGSAVNPESTAHETPRAVVIAVVREGREIDGTGVIKRTRRKYASGIALSSQYSFDPDTPLELGYVAVNENKEARICHTKLSRRCFRIRLATVCNH